MSDKTHRIWCLVDGDTTFFHVDASPTLPIAGLKDLIKEKCKNGVLNSVDAADLTLWKLLRDIPLIPSKTIAERIRNQFLGSQFTQELDQARSVAAVWPEPHNTENLHIIVGLPSARAITQWSTPSDDVRRAGKRARPSDPFDERNTVPGNASPQDTSLNHTPPKPRADVMRLIDQILDRYRSAMRNLVTNAGREPLIPSWIPKTGNGETAFRKHIEMLGIPSVLGMPSLLLHDLQSEASNISRKQAEYIADIFSIHKPTVLINTSGSGKTRLGLQGLCQNWGFYGVIKKSEDDIGSGDFWDLISSLDGSNDYRAAKSRGIHDEGAALHMDEKAQHCVLQFLLARFLLLNLLIAEASECEGGLRPSDHRLLWVLLQARPTDMLGKDVFMELANALWIGSVEFLETQIREQYSKLEDFLGHIKDPATGKSRCRPLYCLLDEIQTTTTIRMGEYRSDDTMDLKERPVLRPIWKSMTGVLEPTQMLLILSGTAIDESSLLDVSRSSIFKFKPYIIVRDIGAFDDPDAQRHYIERYLPDEESAARQEFLKRAWGWCRGRYRSTATLITLILVAGPYSPHKILDNFVKRTTNFLPSDGEDWYANEPDIHNFDMENVRGWSFDRLNPRQIGVLRQVLSSQIVYGSYTLEPFAHEADIKAFIEYGIARTKSKSKEDVIDEPLAIMAVSHNQNETEQVVLEFAKNQYDEAQLRRSERLRNQLGSSESTSMQDG